MEGIGAFLSSDWANSSTSNNAEPEDYERSVSVKDYSNPYYCKICQIDCTSDVALEQHESGAKHKRQMKSLGLGDKIEDVKPNAVYLKNLKKFPTLADKLVNEENSGEPIIGISMVQEVIKRTDPDSVEPRYICTLCDVKSEVIPMYSHLIGQAHRKRYIRNEKGIRAKSAEEILDWAKRIARKETDQRIKVVKSDSRYADLVPKPLPIKECRLPSLCEIQIPCAEGDRPLKALLEQMEKGTLRNEKDSDVSKEIICKLVLKLAEYRSKKSDNYGKEHQKWNEFVNSFHELYNRTPQVKMEPKLEIKK